MGGPWRVCFTAEEKGMNDSREHSGRPEAIRVENLWLGYGGRVILEDVSLIVHAGEIVTILGTSGCGKSTLMRGMIGLLPPRKGRIFFQGREVDPEEGLDWARQKMGVLFQSGALIGSLTLSENVSLPIEEHSDLPEELIRDIVQFKLELVGLGSFGSYLPSELSGGMRKRAALARAMALDPEILFCDEPSSGLNPITSVEMDELLLELNSSLGITMVVITHELPSIEKISHRCIVLDGQARGIIATGKPAELKADHRDPRVQAFFRRQTLDG